MSTTSRCKKKSFKIRNFTIEQNTSDNYLDIDIRLIVDFPALKLLTDLSIKAMHCNALQCTALHCTAVLTSCKLCILRRFTSNC